MKRYIKVNNQWIDTLEDLKQYGRTYYVIDGKVYYLWDETLEEYEVGDLQDERDNQLLEE